MSPIPSSSDRYSFRWLLILISVILVAPILVYGIGVLRVMNTVQIPLSDVDMRTHAEALWANPQIRTFDIKGQTCTPPRSMAFQVAYATVNNQLVETTIETPYGGVDSSAFSPVSVCLAIPASNEVSLVRVVMYEAINPFDFALFEWTTKGSALALPPIPNPVTGGVMENRAYDLWNNPQPEDDLFERPWIEGIADKTSVIVCFRMHIAEFSWIEGRANGTVLNMAERPTGESDTSILQRIACFVMPSYNGRILLQAIVQDSPTRYQIHQWAVEVVYDDLFYKNKACLAISEATSKCF
jgi:hypothetical protein